jgi:hypothetical protein
LGVLSIASAPNLLLVVIGVAFHYPFVLSKVFLVLTR